MILETLVQNPELIIRKAAIGINQSPLGEAAPHILSQTAAKLLGDDDPPGLFTHTYPKLLAEYSYPKKAGLRALHFLAQARKISVDKRPEFFKHTAEQDENRYIHQTRRRKLRDIVQTTEAVIKNQATQHPKGIIAGIVYGSYARNTNTIGSDLDIAYIQSEDEVIHYDEELQHGIRYDEEATIALNMAIHPLVDNFYGAISVRELKDLKRLTRPGHIMKPPHIIVSPFPEIKKRVEQALR